MAAPFPTLVPGPTNSGEGPKRDTLICTFCRQRRIKCQGEYDHSKGGKCDPCKKAHLACSPREAAPGVPKDDGTRKRKRVPDPPHHSTPQPATSAASNRSYAPARLIQPRISPPEDKCADVKLANLLNQSLFDAWKCRLAQAFDPGRPSNALGGREILGRLKDTLDINCENRISWLGEHAKALEKELANLRRQSPVEHEQILPLLELPGWLEPAPLYRSVPSPLSIGTYHAQQVLKCFRRYASDHSDLAPLFCLELLRVGGQKFVLDNKQRLDDVYSAFERLTRIFTELYDESSLKKLAPPFGRQESCFSPLLLCEQFGFQKLTDRFSTIRHGDYKALQCDPIGQTVFHMRCGTSNGRLSPSFLRNHAEAANQSDSFNMTPIQIAVHTKNFDAVNTLLQELERNAPGTALLQCYRTDWGVLLIACHRGCWQNVELLLQKTYGDGTDYDPKGNPQPLDDQMAKSLRITLEGEGSNPDKMHIIRMLANYGVRHHENVPLTRIARTLRLEQHIQNMLIDLERQWEAEAIIPRSSTKTGRSRPTQASESQSHASNRRTVLAPNLDGHAARPGFTGFISFQGSQDYGLSTSYEQLDHEANVSEEDASDLDDNGDEQSEESSRSTTEEIFRDDSINNDTGLLPPSRILNVAQQMHQQTVSPIQPIQGPDAEYPTIFDATTNFGASNYAGIFYGEPQVGQNNATLGAHSPTQYQEGGHQHWSNIHAPRMYPLHSTGHPQMSPMLQNPGFHTYGAQARAPWRSNNNAGGMSPVLNQRPHSQGGVG